MESLKVLGKISVLLIDVTFFDEVIKFVSCFRVLWKTVDNRAKEGSFPKVRFKAIHVLYIIMFLYLLMVIYQNNTLFRNPLTMIEHLQF